MKDHITSHALNVSASCLLAYVTSNLVPDVQLIGGGVHPSGFYFDFIFPQAFHVSLLALIESEFKNLIKADIPIHCRSMMRENAVSLLRHLKFPDLADNVEETSDNIITVLQIEEFYCPAPAPYIESTIEIASLKLLEGIEIDNQFIRVIGIVRDNPQSLKQFMKAYERRRKKGDHRQLLQELQFWIHSSAISPFEGNWLPKGLKLKQIIKNWLDTQRKNCGIDVYAVQTPTLLNQDFFPTDDALLIECEIQGEYGILAPTKLLNHLKLMKEGRCALDPLPTRLREESFIFKQIPLIENEGLLRCPSYETEETTIFCRPNELKEELISSLHFIEQIITMLGFEGRWVYLTSVERTVQKKAQRALLAQLKEMINVQVFAFPIEENPEEHSGIYGPSLELRIQDSLGREWGCSRVSLVMNSPMTPTFIQERSLEVLSQQTWISLERLVALLVEKTEGALPLWLAPEQVRLIAIGDHDREWAAEVYEGLLRSGIRTVSDFRPLKLAEKIHQAELERIPYLILIGEQESNKRQLTIRSTQQPGAKGMAVLDQFIAQIMSEGKEPLIAKKCFKAEVRLDSY